MCMILRNNDTDKHVAEADIVVYKVVNKISDNKYESVYKGHVYEKDKVNDGSISTRIVITKGRIKTEIAEEGFHSYKCLKDAKYICDSYKFIINHSGLAKINIIIIECIIPKGSVFYNGFQEYYSKCTIDQYVSDKIIVKEEIKI